MPNVNVAMTAEIMNRMATRKTFSRTNCKPSDSKSGGGAADFVLKKSDKKPQALVNGRFFEHFLSTECVVHESGCDPIGEHFQIAELREVAIDFWREPATGAFHL